jgi:hypothetical protein
LHFCNFIEFFSQAFNLLFVILDRTKNFFAGQFATPDETSVPSADTSCQYHDIPYMVQAALIAAAKLRTSVFS